jgi:hypothetical protein
MNLRPDPEYIAARDALIPIAEARANLVAGPCPETGLRADVEVWEAKWNQYFFWAMDNMARSNNLIN